LEGRTEENSNIAAVSIAQQRDGIWSGYHMDESQTSYLARFCLLKISTVSLKNVSSIPGWHPGVPVIQYTILWI